ncbi:MAG TPA: 1-phosphofructokinase [Halanaerobiales bacterium]|nr:1-phosphofructokinase [Halanaerobiales bacterium]
MIKTLTLNPAVDKTIIVEDFKIDNLNRVKEVYKDAGGKGINVSKMINNLNGKTTATGFLGGYTGKYIKEELDKMNIEHDFIEVEKETRTNIKMVDRSKKTFTDINENGALVSKEKIQRLKSSIFSNLKEDDILTLSGSVPKGLNDTIYAEIIEMAKEKKIETILDADGNLFAEGVKAGPTLIKPNDHELSMYFNKDFKNLDEMIKAAQRFFDTGIEMVMLSLGEKGAVFLNKEKKIKINPLQITVKSTVGAGDAMVAGLALGMEKKLSAEEMVSLAAAASSASLVNNGTEMGKKEEVEKFIEKIEISYIS